MIITAKSRCKPRKKAGARTGDLTEPGTPAVLAPGRGNLRPPWQPGQSGNPGGWSDAVKEAQRIAREATPAAMLVLIELFTDADGDPRVRAVAANAILDRAMGKPKELPPERDKSPALDLSSFSDAELVQFHRLVEKAAAAPSAPATEIVDRGDEADDC